MMTCFPFTSLDDAASLKQQTTICRFFSSFSLYLYFQKIEKTNRQRNISSRLTIVNDDMFGVDHRLIFVVSFLIFLSFWAMHIMTNRPHFASYAFIDKTIKKWKKKNIQMKSVTSSIILKH